MNAETENSSPRIAALSGNANVSNQALLADFVQKRRAEGLRVAGLFEVPERGEGGACGRLSVVDVATGTWIAISQNLGPGSTACNLDPGGVAEACAAAQRAIDGGADLVVLSKFGKLEAARSGLCDAFAAAIEAELPIVTTVNPVLRQDWARFAGSLSDDVFSSAEALEAWWSANSGASLKDRRGVEAA
jgi:nucleoside-triphosphatase THEP1